MSIHDTYHKKIVSHLAEINDWFSEKRKGLSFPIYGSFDIRDSGCKICPVDANIYPAGFNNICQADKDSSVELLRKFIESHYPDVQNILLLAEEHTNNAYYLENAYTIKGLIKDAGFGVQVGIPKEVEAKVLETSSGASLKVYGSKVSDGKVTTNDGFMPDLIISNNDFSTQYPEWVEGLSVPLNPPYELGWHRRRKETFFSIYNELASELAAIIDVPPCMLEIRTEAFRNFDISNEESRNLLAKRADEVLAELKENYTRCQLKYDPFLFIKNNSGTYGLGVTMVKSGDEIRSWNNRSRTKMKAAKGGGGFGEVIIQEGIPTSLSSSVETSEIAIYMLGCELSGGFLRTHNKKGPNDNLNSPGAVFKRLCVSDLKINVEGNPLENVYGWIAKLGFLAIALEAKKSAVEFKGYLN